jgi:hypothetical protein
MIGLKRLSARAFAVDPAHHCHSDDLSNLVCRRRESEQLNGRVFEARLSGRLPIVAP